MLGISTLRFSKPQYFIPTQPHRTPETGKIFRTLVVDGDSTFVDDLKAQLGGSKTPEGDRFEVVQEAKPLDTKAPPYEVILLGESLPDPKGKGIRSYAADRKLVAQLKKRNPNAFFFTLDSNPQPENQDGRMSVIWRRLDPKATIAAIRRSLERIACHLKAS